MELLSTPTKQLAFPVGTADTPWTFVVTGTDATGAAFNDSADSDSDTNTIKVDLPAGGTYTLVVTKNGVSSLPSLPFTVGASGTVMLSVPDDTQAATISDAT